jgi:hypothetical protein
MICSKKTCELWIQMTILSIMMNTICPKTLQSTLIGVWAIQNKGWKISSKCKSVAIYTHICGVYFGSNNSSSMHNGEGRITHNIG